MLSEKQAQLLACKFAKWVFSHCELHPSGWIRKYSRAIEVGKTIEQMYDYWYDNIKE
jgi:uncharacterized membrane protein